MISARLRYAGLGLAAITFGFLAFLYACAARPGAVALCLVLAGACAEACSWVRRAAERLQDLEHAARPWLVHPLHDPCCEDAFFTRSTHHSPDCTAPHEETPHR